MPFDPVKVLAVHLEVRGYFKGQIKSGNKGYHKDLKHPAGQPDEKDQLKHALRNKNMLRARPLIQEQRLALRGYPRISTHDYGFSVLDHAELAGNCNEMVAAAVFLVNLRGAGTAWHVTISDPGDHAFCMVNDGREPTKTTVKDFVTDTSSAWIIDPWANVCCPIQKYQQQFREKMQQWSDQRKYINVYASRLGTWTDTNPVNYNYLLDFARSYLIFRRSPPGVSKTLPRFMHEFKSGAPALNAPIIPLRSRL